jgi:hypothetical protein
MRTSLIVGITLIVLPGIVQAQSPRACAQVSALVEASVRPLFADPAARACLATRNICSLVSKPQNEGTTLITAEATRDVPAASGQPALLVRSIPRLRNDSNQYCLVAQRVADVPSAPVWVVFGWVIPANAGPVLPLQRQPLDTRTSASNASLRALAAALWSFAGRMSGQ